MIFILFAVFSCYLALLGCWFILSHRNLINEIFFFGFFLDRILCALSCNGRSCSSSTLLIYLDSIKRSAKLGTVVEAANSTLVMGVVLLIISVTIN